MQKVFGLLVIVGMIWIGVEVMTKGDAAFGGMFASGEPAAEDKPWAGERAGDRLSSGHDERAERMANALGE